MLNRRSALVALAAVLLASVVVGVAIWRERLANQETIDWARESARSAVSAGADARTLSDFFYRPVTKSEAKSFAKLVSPAARSNGKGFTTPFWNPLGRNKCVVQVQHMDDSSFAVDVTLERLPGSPGWRVLGMKRVDPK